LLHHRHNCVFRAEEAALHIDGEDAVPFLARHFVREFIGAGNGGIVDQDVELAPFRKDSAHRLGDLLLAGDVNAAIDDVVTSTGKIFGEALPLVLEDVKDCDFRALLDKALDRRSAYTAGASRHDRNLAGQPRHVVSSAPSLLPLKKIILCRRRTPANLTEMRICRRTNSARKKNALRVSAGRRREEILPSKPGRRARSERRRHR
jgi:hypothetical protein